MFFRRLTVIALIAISAQTVLKSQGGSPLANREHPRIWVTRANLPTLRARMASGGGLHSDARTWQAWLDANYTRNWTENNAMYAIQNFAFAYLILKDGPLAGVTFGHSATEYGDKAKSLLLWFVGLNSGQIGDDHQEPAIVAYDWLHPLLTSSERITVANWMKSIDRLSDDGNPFNSVMAARRGERVLAGLAMAGDGIDDNWARARVDSYHALFRSATGITRSESDLGGSDGGAGQGISYLWTYTMRRLLTAEEGYRTAMGLSLASHYGGDDARVFRYQPQKFAYHILPWAPADSRYPGGRHYRLEKSQYMRGGVPTTDAEYTFWLTAVAGLYRDLDADMSQLAQWLIANRTGAMGSDDYSILHNWVFAKFIVGPSTSAPLSPSQLRLPESRYFNEGKFVFRTDWEDPNASYVTMHVNEWHRSPYGMSPQLPGAFQIHRNGPQVINQGGTSGHDWGGAGRAGSANIMIFPDRSISAPTGEWDDEGGHRRLSSATFRGSVDFVQNSAVDARDTLRYLLADPSSNRDVDYVFADLTRSYSSTRYHDDRNPARVSDVVREFVYFRGEGGQSDRVVVLDRATTTNTRFEKTWLFHTAGEPTVNGPATAGPARGGHTHGHTTYSAATQIVATNTTNGSNGKVWLTPLLPAARKVIKIGGPNASGASWKADSHEYESPYGKSYGDYMTNPGLSADLLQYVGQYRIEIVPAVANLSDVFLNVVEVTDAGAGSASDVKLLQGTLIAAQVGDRIAAFAPTNTNLTSGTFTIASSGTYRMHFSNLAPGGSYDVTFGTATIRATATAAGTLYLERSVGGGTNVAVRLVGAALAPRPATNVTMQ